ncbi:MAG: tetratricopeptide repeat protein [Desulfocapsaceae bacterium]|nr:tetratricopeptide repeat protein [Desulfocapsaceae bacterium]
MDTQDGSNHQEEYQAEIAQCKEIIKNNPDDLDTYYRWRMAIAELGFPEDDTKEYLRAIETNLDTPEAYNDLGLLLSDNKQDKLALEAFEKALKKDPDNVTANFESGVLLHNMGMYEEAIRYYRLTLKQDSRNFLAHYNCGLALYSLGRYEEAIEAYEQTVEANPHYADAYNSWGLALGQLGQYEEALNKYQKVFKIDPFNTSAFNNEAIALYNLGKYEEALEKYDRALESDSKYTYLYYRNRGLALEKLGQYEEAAKDYDQSIIANPGYVDAYNSWGLVLDKLGLREEAIEKYQKALEIGDTDTAIIAATHNRMGIAFYNLGRYEEALKQYEEALAIDPDYAHVYYHNQGLVFERQTKYEQAIDRYNNALQADPEYVAAYNSLGIALEQLGRLEEAIKQYDRALTIEHDQQEFTLFNKGLALEKLSRYEEAIDAYKKACDLNANYPYPAHNIASIRERSGLLEESAKWWQTACEAYERGADEARNNHEVHHFYNHARVYHYSFNVDFEKAIAIYYQGLDLDPENILILFGLARLYQDLKNQEITYNGGKSSAETKAEGHWKSKEYLGKLEKLLVRQVEERKDKHSLSQLGEVYYLMGENHYAQAIDCIRQALDINEDIPRAAELLGMIYLHKNRPKKAIEYFRQEQGVSPDDLNIRSMEADACRMAKLENRAEAIYREILEINSSHIDALSGLGEIYALKGERNMQNKEPELAEENFNQAMDLYAKARETDDAYKTHLGNSLNVKRASALIYSHAYAKIRLYEALPRRNKNQEYLKDAIRYFNQITNSYPNSVYKYRADSIRKKISRHLEPSEDRATRIGARLIFLFACTVFILAQFSFFLGQPIFSPAYVFTENKLQEIVAMTDSKNIYLTPELMEMLDNLSKNQYSSFMDFDSLVYRNIEQLSNNKDPEVQDAITFVKNKVIAAKVLQNRGRLRFVDFAPITSTNYALITFGALLFMVASLYLQEITRIKVPGLELEKAPTEQISTSSSLVLGREFSKMEPGSSSPSIQKMQV